MAEPTMISAPPQDDDHTRVLPGAPFSYAGGETGQSPDSTDNSALRAGTRLGEYEILGTIGKGGFGIVYLAYDHLLQRKVALKEYMPSVLSTRTGDSMVSMRSERHPETFQAGLRGFITEAQLLAQFDHPSLVKVYRFWEENGTAYMAMPFYEGVTLKQVLQQRKTPPDEAWLRNFLSRILDALEVIHARQCFHRDIAPDNIMILDGDLPLLLDFGAARRVISDMTHAPTAILKPGYAPLEQYAEIPGMKQGAWTDLYALAAVVYMAITGRIPTPSVARAMSDPVERLSTLAGNRYSASLLRTIDTALAVVPEKRPQSVQEFRAMLNREPDAPQTTGVTEKPPSPPPAQALPATHQRRTIRNLAAGAAAIALLGGGAWLFYERQQNPSSPPPIVQSTPPASAPVLAPSKPSFDPARALDEVFQGRNQQQTVTVSVENAKVRIGKDPLRFTVKSSHPGHVYLLMLTADHSNVYLLFPNALDKNNRITPDKALPLPRAGWRMMADGPPGTDQFLVMVSDTPRDFNGIGLKNQDPFSEFTLDTAARNYASYSGKQPFFAGKTICPAEAKNGCSESFGAATFSIEEIAAEGYVTRPPSSRK